jgi:hypothetical protein
MAGTQLYIERVVWEHLVLEEAAEAPGTTFTCFTSTKVQKTDMDASVTGPLLLEEAFADWEEEPEWRRLAEVEPEWRRLAVADT